MNHEAFETWMKALEAPENQVRQGRDHFSQIEFGPDLRRDYTECCAVGLAMMALIPDNPYPEVDDVQRALGDSSSEILSVAVTANDHKYMTFAEIAAHLRAYVVERGIVES